MPGRRLILLALLAACGKPDGDTATDTATTTAATTSSSTSTTDTPTTSSTTSTTGDALTTDLTTSSTSTTATSTTSTTSTTGAATTTDPDTSTGEGDAFERFTMNNAAGPCPPDADCDGFVELLADGTLRVQKFGEVGDPVIEALISQADLDAAVPVFTDPALIALLDGPDPACDPPTDIFESMTVQIAGIPHDSGTTFCDQPPIAAARAMATMLRDTYAP